MRMILAASLALGLFATAQADEKFAGKWVVESLQRDGKADTSLVGGIRVHDGDKYTVTPPTGSTAPTVSGTLVVDTSKTPATIDMKPSSGRYKDKTLLGIMKIDGEQLIIAFAEPGKERPTSFESKAGSGVVVAVHKKAK